MTTTIARLALVPIVMENVTVEMTVGTEKIVAELGSNHPLEFWLERLGPDWSQPFTDAVDFQTAPLVRRFHCVS